MEIIVLIGRDHSVHRPLLAQSLGQGTGVNSGDPRDILFLQEILQSPLTAEIAGHPGQFSYNISIRPRPLRFHIRCNPIIPDQRIRHHHRLSGVRRICQHLKISCHRSIEHNLTDHIPRGAYTCSCKDCPVFQYKKCFHIFTRFLSEILTKSAAKVSLKFRKKGSCMHNCPIIHGPANILVSSNCKNYTTKSEDFQPYFFYSYCQYTVILLSSGSSIY